MKKLTVLFLALMLIASSFVSCVSKDNNNTGDTTTQQSTGDDIPPDSFKEIKLRDTNEEIYTLIRPDMQTDAIQAGLQRIIAAAKNLTGCIGITPGNDWIKKGTDTSGYHEILLGYTNREETKQVMESIGYDDYAIRAVNNKIVIAAHTEKRLDEAVNYFCKNSMRAETDENGIVTLYYIGNYHMKSEKSFVIDGDNPLSGYTIVCDTSNKNSEQAANSLSEAIRKTFGVTLSVKDDGEAETECEIIIGNIKRDACKKFFEGSNAVTAFEYIIGTSGKKLVIGSTTDNLTLVAVNSFCDEYVNRYSYTFNFEKESRTVSSMYNFSDKTELAEGSDIRIMSFNILCELWNDQLPVQGRDSTVVATILGYAPDVVGLQEVSDKWHKSFNELFGTTYKITDSKTEKGVTNFSTLAYNTEKVKLIEHGVNTFSKGNDQKLRLVTWGLFEKLDSGKRFIVMTTHWDLSKNDSAGYRQTHSDEMAALANKLKNQYKCPVVATGDFNTSESESMYKNFIDKTGFTEAKYTAAKVNRACKTTHNVGTTPSLAKANSIDHIFGSSDAKFMYYNVLIDQVIIDASDHCPIYADIKLN